ncbi:MAG: response regulator [Pseudomonadota bacterium]|nr:response regulator [Pseudomonadota bacterium]
MTQVNSKEALKELLFNIQQKDLIKARLVIEHLAHIDPATQKRMLFELSKSDDDFAIPLLAYLIHCHPEITDNYPTLKELLLTKVLDHPNVLIAKLATPVPEAVIYLRLAGQLREERAVPAIAKFLTSTNDVRLLKAGLNALGEIAEPTAVNAITEFLYADIRPLVLAAVRSLGQVGTTTALQRLAERMGGDRDLDAMILEIFARVQNDLSLHKLNETLQSHYAYLRNLAKKHLATIGAKAVPLLIHNLQQDDPDLIIHTLNILGEIGDASAISSIRKLLHAQPHDANIRFAAYEALGMLPLGRGVYALAGGLTDPVENVRAAAARAINGAFSEVLAAGVKNMVRSGGAEAEAIIRAIIDVQADKIVLSLIDEQVFQQFGGDYLAARAHPEIRDYFLHLFQQQGYQDLATTIEKVAGRAAPEPAARPLACAVDDSRMILKIYQNILYELGYEPVIFEFPAAALEWLEKEKPAVLFTDLNMPEITGVELIEKVRQLYAKEELSIIMVTTQNEMQDNEAALAAGVNDILAKPFTAETLQAAIEKKR